MARRIVEFFARPARRIHTRVPELTTREHEVLDLIAAGRSNGCIPSLDFKFELAGRF